MQNQNEKLEAEICAIQAINGDARSRHGVMSMRDRVTLDRHYRCVLDLLAPRFRFFIRKYGLLDMQDDAMQACAIAAYRAADEFDGEKASFATFVTWKIRGELQSLRHRMRLDQRASAKRVGARTISIDAVRTDGSDDPLSIADDDALTRTESAASYIMARRYADCLLDEYAWNVRRKACGRNRTSPAVKPGTIGPEQLNCMEIKLKREREIITSHLIGDPDPGEDGSLTSEQKRQITRRVLRHLGRQIEAQPNNVAPANTLH